MEAPDKSLESWIWDAACSIRGAKDAGKHKDYILKKIFARTRLSALLSALRYPTSTPSERKTVQSRIVPYAQTSAALTTFSHELRRK